MRCMRCREQTTLYWCKTITGITLVACTECIAKYGFQVLEKVKLEKRKSESMEKGSS